MWKHWFLPHTHTHTHTPYPPLPLWNVGDLNNLRERGDSVCLGADCTAGNLCSASNPPIGLSFRGIHLLPAEPSPSPCVHRGGVCEATWLTIEKGESRHLARRPHIIMTLFNSVANGCLCATNYWWRIIISPPIGLHHADGFLLSSPPFFPFILVCDSGSLPRISVLAI